MKISINYTLLILMISSLALNAGTVVMNDEVIVEQAELCYCSDLCGPRNVKSGDEPFYDEEHGLCFCAQRDKDNYIPNGCSLQEKQDFTSVCDEQNEGNY